MYSIIIKKKKTRTSKNSPFKSYVKIFNCQKGFMSAKYLRNTACSIHGCSMSVSKESGPLDLLYTLPVQTHHRLAD